MSFNGQAKTFSLDEVLPNTVVMKKSYARDFPSVAQLPRFPSSRLPLGILSLPPSLAHSSLTCLLACLKVCGDAAAAAATHRPTALPSSDGVIIVSLDTVWLGRRGQNKMCLSAAKRGAQRRRRRRRRFLHCVREETWPGYVRFSSFREQFCSFPLRWNVPDGMEIFMQKLQR